MHIRLSLHSIVKVAGAWLITLLEPWIRLWSVLVLSTLVAASELPTTDHEVVVIGAGRSGLTAGYFLQQQGIDAVILEAQRRTGGNVQAGKKGDFHYSKSTQPYLSDIKPALKEIVDELNIPLVEIPLPVTALLNDSKIYMGCSGINKLTTGITGENNFNSFLESMSDLIDHYKEGGNFRAKAARTSLDLLSAAQWMNDLRIHPFIQARYDVMIRSQFGASLEDISAYSLASERHLLKASGNVKEHHSHLWSPLTGIITITDTLTEKLGSAIRLGASVTEISFSNKIYHVHYQHKEQPRTIRCRSLVISTPAPITLSIAESVLTDTQRKLLQQISYTSYITLALYSDQPIFNNAFSLTLLNGGFITEIYDATWIERHAVKEKANGKPFIVSTHLAPHNFQDNSLIDMSDDQLLTVIRKELDHIEKDIAKRITGYDIQRFPLVCPVMSPGAYHRLDELSRSQRGVYLAGDYTIHPSFEAAIESGFDAAKKAAAWIAK